MSETVGWGDEDSLYLNLTSIKAQDEKGIFSIDGRYLHWWTQLPFWNQCKTDNERLYSEIIISWDISMNWQVPTKYDIFNLILVGFYVRSSVTLPQMWNSSGSFKGKMKTEIIYIYSLTDWITESMHFLIYFYGFFFLVGVEST